jgi:MraZ protein
MSIFLSTYVKPVDLKGRVVVPKEFRLVLEKFHGFVAFRSHKQDAVDCFSMERMEKLSTQIDESLDPFSIDRDSLESAIFADAVTLHFDKDGRVVLPEILLKHAQIDEQIAFVGRGSTFQIWNPDAFKEHQESVRKMLSNKKVEK